MGTANSTFVALKHEGHYKNRSMSSKKRTGN